MDISQAKKEVGKVKKLAEAIVATSEALDVLQGKEQNAKELAGLIAKAQTELATINSDIEKAGQALEVKGRELAKAEEKVKAELMKAEAKSLAEANEIMASAKAEADKLGDKSKKLAKTIKEREAALDLIEKQTEESNEKLAKAQKAVQDLFKNVR